MKRIVLFTDKLNSDALELLGKSLSENGCSLETGIPRDSYIEKKGDLVIVDSFVNYLHFKEKCLILINKPEDMDEFSGARYFVMEPEYAEFDYFEKIYKRLNNLPWDILTTERLLLRETVESDVDSFYEMYKDPDMTRYTEKLYDDPGEEKKYVAEYREKVYSTQGFGIWTVIEKKTGRIIGRAGLVSRAGFDRIELGFAIGKAYWNKGFGTEAVKGCIEYAKEHDLMPLQALVMEGNIASEKLLKKAGLYYKEPVNVNGVRYNKWITD